MYAYNRKKEIIKNTVYITFILLLAVISTYYIYNKFQKNRSIDFNSASLDITYHEASGDKLTIKKITPVTDSVGLSSKAYTLTVTNNLTENVNYQIKILDDKEANEEYEEESLIPKEDIRISVKVSKEETEIYNLDELTENNNILLDKEIEALDTDNISIRIWIKQDTKLPVGSDMYYNGIIQLIENNTSVAMNK
ncbi:MAG: hypothetical protein IJG97_03970 [Bacilli bacterium]|nr:hypothetical protein [Bacilli bacterium]